MNSINIKELVCTKFSQAEEHKVEILFAIIGTAAILANLFVKGIGLENFLDATGDIVGFLVTIVVFVLAKNVYQNMTHGDFVGRFEALIKEWAEKNSYLVDNQPPTEKGQEGKRAYFMLIDPSNLVTAEILAKDSSKKKGAFVYLPTRKQLEGLESDQNGKPLTIEFSLNKGTFLTKRGSNEIMDEDVPVIAAQITRRINATYSDSLSIKAKIKDGYPTVIVLPIADMPTRSEETARLLVEVVDFVKSLILALSRPSDDYMAILKRSSEGK